MQHSVAFRLQDCVSVLFPFLPSDLEVLVRVQRAEDASANPWSEFSLRGVSCFSVNNKRMDNILIK